MELSGIMAADVFAPNRLSLVMQDLGYACTADEKTFKQVLRQVPEVNEETVAEVLSMMVRTYQGLSDQLGLHLALSVAANGQLSGGMESAGGSTWNLNMVMDVLKAAHPGMINWKQVAELLDHPEFLLPDQQSFMLLASAFLRGSGQQLPLAAVVGKRWVNSTGQMSLLHQAVLAPPELFSFEGSEHKIAPVEGLVGGKSPIGTPNHAWRSVDLLHVLCVLSEAGHLVPARQMLEIPVQQCPELLLLTVASVPPTEWSLLQQEVLSALLPLYLPGALPGQPASPNSSVLLHRLWASNQRILLEALVAFFDQDNSHLPGILDVCLELKALNQVLDSTQYRFSRELAALAASKEQVVLERWLNDSISRDHVVFTQAVLRFLDLKLQAGLDPQALQQQAAAGKAALTEATVRAFFKVLNATAGAGALPNELVQEIKKLQQLVTKASPELGKAIAPAEAFASDVEEEANSYFQKIYSEQKPIDEVVQMLKQFKSSPSSREQEVFACMIHNLFDEYRCAAQAGWWGI